jgi:hypothetical protein
MADQADSFLEFWKEQRNKARHTESQRQIEPASAVHADVVLVVHIQLVAGPAATQI